MTSMALNSIFVFLALTGLYEPSAIQQLADGRVSTAPLSPGSLPNGGASWKLDDLEGLALDQTGYVYALTSHSRDGDGDEKKSRDKLIRFRIEGNRAIIASDDGDREAGRHAQFLLPDPAQRQMAH